MTFILYFETRELENQRSQMMDVLFSFNGGGSQRQLGGGDKNGNIVM
jgi:hypothetical protein